MMKLGALVAIVGLSPCSSMNSTYTIKSENGNVVDKVPDRLKVPNYEQERVSDEDDRRLNEIFDEFEDDEFIPKKTLH